MGTKILSTSVKLILSQNIVADACDIIWLFGILLLHTFQNFFSKLLLFCGKDLFCLEIQNFWINISLAAKVPGPRMYQVGILSLGR